MGSNYVDTGKQHPIVRVNGFVREINTIAEKVCFTFEVGIDSKVIRTAKYRPDLRMCESRDMYVSPGTYNQMMRQVYAIASENKGRAFK